MGPGPSHSARALGARSDGAGAHPGRALQEVIVELLESDPDAADIVQSQKNWISVDEYQDTNPLQERLLELWIGESRDLAVVGDPDQTIYTLTAATPSVANASSTSATSRSPGLPIG